MRWASDRAQVLSRTVRGVMRYGDGSACSRARGWRPPRWRTSSARVRVRCTCQITPSYGGREGGRRGRSRDRRVARLQAQPKVAYVDAGEDGCYYSVLLGVAADGSDQACTGEAAGQPDPRRGEAREPEPRDVFTRGEYLQTLDMNQDNYGRGVQDAQPARGLVGDVRLVGFREHIFSSLGGIVAEFAVQRVRLRHQCSALHDVAAPRPLPLRPPRRVGQDVGAEQRRLRRRRARSTCPRTSSAASTSCCAAAPSSTRSTLSSARRATSPLRGDALRAGVSGGNAWQVLERDFSRLGKGCDLPPLLDVHDVVGRLPVERGDGDRVTSSSSRSRSWRWRGSHPRRRRRRPTSSRRRGRRRCTPPSGSSPSAS